MLTKKLIPTNKHSDKGKIYLGIYILFNKEKFATTALMDEFDASL